MADEGPNPKLFASKPKKSKLKASVTASSSSMGSTAPPPPLPPSPPQAKAVFRSLRVFVPLVLALNFSIGAYILVKTALRDKRISEEEIPEGHTSSTSSSNSSHEAQTTTTVSKGSTA